MKFNSISIFLILFCVCLVTNTICKSESNIVTKYDINEFIERINKIYSVKSKPEIDYLERPELGIQKRIMYAGFLCVEFVNKTYAEKYFQNLLKRTTTNQNGIMERYAERGFNICLVHNYVIEHYLKGECDVEKQIILEDQLFSPYFKKNKTTFIRLKCGTKTLEIR
jgi:hypothetical protein